MSIGLSQVADPGIFGIREEPERIMFYAGTGALAGFSGLFAVISGIYLAANRDGRASATQRRFILGIVAITLIAVATAIAIRVSSG